ncbi:MULTISPECIES: class I SAM-dependent methyltransferase [Xanthomonas]|uniref:SAM-dependent methyltransferase n=1 Tax=Xanthomonas cucurbitae TaxID=56453 RepID=A0A2S7DSJ5_9XANT|nr:class I SAM-dependent methyltransferase [Xanthomonas cucurbitae]PPU76787.1 SAM-dependent methyltransferase [Xanthomonas cucurbitae]WDM66055.1 class I SAM-dependent methyltransferase [Xanthomonas cucurbitae]WDM69934.1 class I SAM-dependent methyltransferase [Xanthomonas cucurbitae]WDM73851.1 class I SAM-dependent methyltransferase [Xanthomonas cucurbitae]WDM80686.1 class I SAM-dependent methyltransferase [Xanthomonas cucurbitae]
MNRTVPASAQRFDDRVAAYVRYRPGYPPQLLRWLHDTLGITPATPVADIGAGTGISSRLFLEAGYTVTAVEPNPAMRAAAQHWLAEFGSFQAIDGTAEATGLADASVSLVSAAQAFHWFDTQAVRREWTRILQTGGLAVVYWNSRELDSTAFLRGYEQLLLDYGTDYSAVAERYQDDATMQAWFGDGFRAMARFPNVQRLDFDALRGRLLSSSYAPLAHAAQHAPMLAALRTLFDAHAHDGVIDFHYQTRIFAGSLN